jgi:hypothetical protein
MYTVPQYATEAQDQLPLIHGWPCLRSERETAGRERPKPPALVDARLKSALGILTAQLPAQQKSGIYRYPFYVLARRRLLIVKDEHEQPAPLRTCLPGS